MIASSFFPVRGTVRRYINGANDKKTFIWKARNQKVSNRNRLRILREAERKKKSARDIKEILGVSITVRREK